MNSVNLASGRKITLDKEKCVKCWLCEKLCPKRNITMKEYTEWDKYCEVCIRCINFCTMEAVYILGKKFERYHSV